MKPPAPHTSAFFMTTLLECCRTAELRFTSIPPTWQRRQPHRSFRAMKKFFDWWHARRRQRALEEWERQGRPVPPPHVVKQSILRRYAQQYHLKIFVETGTYRGDMVEAMKPLFHKIYSIELSDTLFAEAKHRFKRHSHIELLHGDSGKELGRIMERLDQPALFWLDGHYSAGDTARAETDTPIYQELDHILRAPALGHVIVIDDARCFGSDPAYPTIQALREYVRSKRPRARIAVEDDSIRITPPEP